MINTYRVVYIDEKKSRCISRIKAPSISDAKRQAKIKYGAVKIIEVDE